VSQEDRPFSLGLARVRGRSRLARNRLTYDPATDQLTCRSDKTDRPTTGTQAVDPLEPVDAAAVPADYGSGTVKG